MSQDFPGTKHLEPASVLRSWVLAVSRDRSVSAWSRAFVPVYMMLIQQITITEAKETESKLMQLGW